MEELLKRIELLEWKVQILEEHVEMRSFFNILMELNITKQQHSAIVDLIQKYADDYYEVWDSKVHNRYSFEEEMASINSVFSQNTQAVEIIVKDLAESENDYRYKLLFKRLYGDMLKYNEVFPDIKVTQ